MALTSQQLTTLKTAIAADPALSSLPNNDDANVEIAAAFNALASPAFTVWQSKLTMELSRSAIVAGAVQLDNLTAGKRDALLYLVRGDLDCRIAAVRQAIDDLTGTQNTLKNALIAAEKRFATRAEKLFATGTGSDASPATTTFEGAITHQDVSAARNN